MSAHLQESIRVIAPSIFPHATWNDAEVLGTMVWLWNINSDYQKSALDCALGVLLPIIKSRNFILVINKNKPIGYMNLAYFDNTEEKSYLNQTNDYLSFVQCFQADQTKKIMDINFFVHSV